MASNPFNQRAVKFMASSPSILLWGKIRSRVFFQRKGERESFPEKARPAPHGWYRRVNQVRAMSQTFQGPVFTMKGALNPNDQTWRYRLAILTRFTFGMKKGFGLLDPKPF
ncbi:MAG: hypothetical protein LW700_02870 [Gemmataceae bacterium]|nr:hypothetical protein [Gemmataceae bacterium]